MKTSLRRSESARCIAPFCFMACVACGSMAHALNITVDYTYDLLANGGTGFFETTPAAKDAVNAAAADISAAIGPSLSAVPTDVFTGVSSGATATIDCAMAFRNPSTGAGVLVEDLAPIQADAFTVYAGMRPQFSMALATGEAATFQYQRTLSGTPANQAAAFSVAASLLNSVMAREAGGDPGPINYGKNPLYGEPLTVLTFGPIAGSISFDVDTDNNGAQDPAATLDAFWHYEHNQPVAAGQADFYTVSLHEILHSLGFGLRLFFDNMTWDQMRAGQDWNGSSVKALNGGSGVNMLWVDESHIGDPDGVGPNGFMSTRITDGAPQEVVMDPRPDPGLRKFLTHMDLAFMQDIGYALAPGFAAGDFNEDNLVDADDLAAWRVGFGTLNSATHMQGDADGDFDVDGADFLGWQRQLDSGLATRAVPEPAAQLMMGLVLAGAVVVMRFRPRGRSLIAPLLVCCMPAASSGADSFWVNAGTGNWFVGSNWSSGAPNSATGHTSTTAGRRSCSILLPSPTSLRLAITPPMSERLKSSAVR
jgi:hypothetical protein